MHQGQRLLRRILLATAAVCVCAACQSKGGTSSGGTGTGASSSDDPPWEDRLTGPRPAEDRESRQCFERTTMKYERPADDATRLGCPPMSELQNLGLYSPPPEQSMSGTSLVEGPAEWKESCCYLLSSWHTGRALELDGVVRRAPSTTRSDWLCDLHPATDLPRAHRDALAAAWAADASAEHASIASFARFALDLLAASAPPDLLVAAHRAALDEIEHARLSFALAGRYLGEPVGPAQLDVQGAVGRGFIDAATAAVREGCIGETEAALLAHAQLEHARDPSIRRALVRIAADEAEHAVLAWRFVAWALTQGDANVHRAVALAFEDILEHPHEQGNGPPAGMQPSIWQAHGRLLPADVSRVRADARTHVIAPAGRALLAAHNGRTSLAGGSSSFV